MRKQIIVIFSILIIIYFSKSCYNEKQEIVIRDVTKESTWEYDIVTVPVIGERQFITLIDGELNSDAALELQTQITTSNVNTANYTYTYSTLSKLPKGKFSLFIDQDDSGPEKFIYHPLGATKGWIRITIKPGQWDVRDSSRKYPVALPKLPK